MLVGSIFYFFPVFEMNQLFNPVKLLDDRSGRIRTQVIGNRALHDHAEGPVLDLGVIPLNEKAYFEQGFTNR